MLFQGKSPARFPVDRLFLRGRLDSFRHAALLAAAFAHVLSYATWASRSRLACLMSRLRCLAAVAALAHAITIGDQIVQRVDMLLDRRIKGRTQMDEERVGGRIE